MSVIFPFPPSARACALSLAAAWVFTCGSAPSALAQTRAGILPELLSPRVEPLGDPLAGKDTKILRSRAVEWNLELLRTLPREGGGRARVVLFDDLVLEAVFERYEAFRVGGWGWTGRLEGLPGEFSLAVVGDAVAATFNPLDGSPCDLQVRPSARGAFVRERERSGGCGTDALRIEPHGGPEGGGVCGDDGSIVTVLIAYTPATRSEAGGSSEIYSIGLNGVLRMNAYMRNSRVHETRMDAVLFYETNYTELCGNGVGNGIDTDYTRLRTENDGYMDDVLTQRTSVRADLAALLIDTDYWCNPSTAGIGGVGGAFSVTQLGEVDYTLAHELGHNFGCGHHTSNSGLLPYGHGYRWWQGLAAYTTVMGYTDLVYSRVPYFSTSDSGVTFNGHVVGDSSHDNARVIRERRVITANFQASRDVPIIARDPRPATICPGNNPSVTNVIAIYGERFQWYRNSALAPGQVSEILAFSNATAADAGWWQCEVTNACGSRWSGPALIQVLPNCDVLYVDGSRAYPGGNGLSWANAFWNLKQALDFANTLGTVREIRVARGTYAPTLPHFIPQRDLTHLVPNGMRIRGGYPSGGGAHPDPAANPTVLTAVIAPGVLSHHVLTSSNYGFDMQLEGLIIEGGRADGNVYERQRGGAVHQIGGSLTVVDCTLRANYSDDFGGAICAEGATVLIQGCVFQGNESQRAGGAVAMDGGSLSITACRFLDNRSTNGVAGVLALQGPTTIASCVFFGNQGVHGAIGAYGTSTTLANLSVLYNRGTQGVGGIEIGSGALANSILWGNTANSSTVNAQFRGLSTQVSFSCIEGVYPAWGGPGNIAANPQLVDPSRYDFHLRPNSPCVDAGTLAAAGLPAIDFEGDPRLDRSGQVDIGADEGRGARLRYLGTGCSGGLGVGGSLSLGGGIDVSGYDPLAFATLYLGVSERSWLGLPLPFAINRTSIGPCNLEISPDLPIYSGLISQVSFASTTLSFPIPADPALAGPEIFLQWHPWVPGTPLAFYYTTRAAGVRFGL